MHMGMVVQDIRKSRNWTVAYLEHRSGVSRQAIYQIEEKGRGKIETYERLLDAMGYELEVVRKEGFGLCG